MLTVKAECSQPTPAAERTTRPGDAVTHRAHALTFEQIVDRHQAYVARLVRRLLGWGAAGDVDDVVQEVFLSVLKGLPRFRGESSIGTWLAQITINACRNHRRGRMMRLAFLGKWIRQAPSAYAPCPGADEREETRRRVRQAVGGCRTGTARLLCCATSKGWTWTKSQRCSD